jgi:thiamine biosynthesis protein ThiI
MKYLLKYSPEMTTKSRAVRTRFCRQLRKNLARILREQLGLHDVATGAKSPESISVEANWDNLQIYIPPEQQELAPRIEEILSNTPGIWGFSRVLSYPLGTFDDMLAQTRAVYAERMKGKTFVVRCRRAGWYHKFSSMDVERTIGAGLLQQTEAVGVSLNKAEITVALEVRDQEFFVVDASMPGIGGFPLGTVDSVISLISGGFDSAVSTFMTMKRGMRAHFLFFNLGGHEHELAVKELSFYLWNRFGSSHHVYFITVPFEEVVREILVKVENSQMGVVLKRMMLRAATAVANELESDALVTGESVAQVSSQTLANLAVIDEICPKLVLRPLIMSDKQDIVDMARKIGTEKFSAVIPEYCGVISVRPATRARRNRIEREEARFDFTVLEQAIAGQVKLDIRSLADTAACSAPAVHIVPVPAKGAVLVDIRHPAEEELLPLKVAGHEILRIPFYRLGSEAADFKRGQQYLLYCGKGVMSRLHASHLRHLGWENIGVYLPGKAAVIAA